MLQERFHPDVISVGVVEACKILKLAFPLSQSKHLRSGVKQTYALGVKVMEAASSQPNSGDRDQLVRRIHELEERLQRYEDYGNLHKADNNMGAQSVISHRGPDTLLCLDEISFDGIISVVYSRVVSLVQGSRDYSF